MVCHADCQKLGNAMKKLSIEQLENMLEDCKCSPYDGKNRLVTDSDKVKADGENWGVVSDHGNVEFCYRGRNGRIYWIGGMV